MDTASFGIRHASLIVGGLTSELLPENAQFDGLSSDLSSRTAIFDSQPVPKGPKSRGPGHKMIVIWITATGRGHGFRTSVKRPADLYRRFSSSVVIFP